MEGSQGFEATHKDFSSIAHSLSSTLTMSWHFKWGVMHEIVQRHQIYLHITRRKNREKGSVGHA